MIIQIPKPSSLRRICRRAADKATDPNGGEGVLGGISDRYEATFESKDMKDEDYSYDGLVIKYQKV